MKTTVLIFTYRGDEYLTPLCVEFVKETLPDAKIVVADDGFNAMFSETRERLIEMGVDYRQTDWPRFGNLLGPFHLEGATRLMAELAKDCDVIVKLDPDAALLKTDWIDRLHNDPKALMTSSYKIKLGYPMGNSYAVKACVCEELAKDAKLYPGWVDCFEDYEIGIRVARIAGGDPMHAIRYTVGVNDGFILTNPWDIDYKLCIARVRVYCSGYNYGSLPLDKKDEYKRKQVEVATVLLSELRKSKSVMQPIVPANIANKTDGNIPGIALPNPIPTGPTGGNMQYMAEPAKIAAPTMITPDQVKVSPELLKAVAPSALKYNIPNFVPESVSVDTKNVSSFKVSPEPMVSVMHCGDVASLATSPIEKMEKLDESMPVKSSQILPEFEAQFGAGFTPKTI